jgi:hypothetical protein
LATISLWQAALFAILLMLMAQMVINYNPTSPAWEALRFFVYAAINSNLVAAGCCAWTIFALDDVAVKAQMLAMTDRDSWPFRVANGEPIGQEINDREALLKAFGADSYWWQAFGAGVWYIFGLFLTFSSLITWMWVLQSKSVAIGVTVVAVPGMMGLVYPIVAGLYKAIFT